ncbi:MAG: hypothetical protein IJ079_08325 [Lachnospiraceae bacterium]|nr:hypothetical protein [Lachnospiraceae bacterium]
MNRWLCVFTIDNKQDNYARLLKMMYWLESISGNDSNAGSNIDDSFFNFIISRAPKIINNSRVLLTVENILSSGESDIIREIVSEQHLLKGFSNNKENNEFCYYIRVMLDNNDHDLTELQYLVLILQSISNITNRIAIRIMKSDDAQWNSGDYFRVSNYLRFIQKKYSCFHACGDNSLSSLRSLKESSNGVQSTFLPLLEVDAQLCQCLNKTWFVKYNYKKEAYDKLYSSLYLADSDSDAFPNDLFMIAMRIMFNNLNGKKYNTEKTKIELLDMICSVINDLHGVTIMDMLLFGALISDKGKKLLYENAKVLMSKVQTLSIAISQIQENIVNHSEHNIGVFTYRIQHNHGYLEEQYPDYGSEIKDKCLELLIADANQQDGIITHFVNSNKADITLKNNSKDISLEHFFGEIKDKEMREIWQNARAKRPEMCHGLLAFYNGVKDLKGAVRVRSSSDYVSNDFKNIYYYNGKENSKNKDIFLQGIYIPGTQFSIVIDPAILNLEDEHKEEIADWAFNYDKLVYATTYKELAQALVFDSDVRKLDIYHAAEQLINNKAGNEYDQTQKDTMVLGWKEWFDSKIPAESDARIVYQCDLESISSEFNNRTELWEPFCKGFLGSRFFRDKQKNVYYSVILQNPDARFSLAFKQTLMVSILQKDFDPSFSCIYFYPKRYHDNYIIYSAATMHDLIDSNLTPDVFPRVFPYTLFLNNEKGMTLFEEEIFNQAGTEIYSREKQGFKIPDTHMRIGNKVHLDSFYEMALFFENPNYAYYTAFLILRDFLLNKPEVFKKNNHLLFYGYASYSRAIIWAMIQIINEYKSLVKDFNKPEIEFVIYQNDLKSESDQPQIQMYYSREEWQRKHTNIWDSENTTLVMVVPISSSLTTFNKMKAELQRETNKDYSTVENYTAFWVRNEYNDDEVSNPTPEEEDFWKSVDPITKTIQSNIVQGEIKYLVYEKCKWRTPLDCKKCFPDDPIMEYPLVETDPTSTVPTQQYYLTHKDNKNSQEKKREKENQNDERVRRLKNNLIYGHISKGNNHYQYYIKIREYFQQEKQYVKIWLEKLREQALLDYSPEVSSPNCLNILIIPQQANNVEFGQYVYEYYFKGCAECIIINTEKEFRSNLQAEYSGLFSRLYSIDNPEDNIRFHYVDVSVHSGASYNRAVSLVSSCLNLNYNGSERNTVSLKIDHIFLLVSRLSDASKQVYVNVPEKKFHTYAEIKISAMRTFGDSCVPCKLQHEANSYYKKSATKSISAYWENKIYDRKCVPFDQTHHYEGENRDLQEEGYRRMICSHRAAYYIRPIQGGEIEDYFQAIRNFLNEICFVNTSNNYHVVVYDEVTDADRSKWLASGLKIIARPFFSYDYKMRCVVMDLYLLLSEYLIKKVTINDLKHRLNNATESSKGYLLKNGNMEWIKTFADKLLDSVDPKADPLTGKQLEFIRNNILKGLADIKSNYILRKDTILYISRQISKAYLNHKKEDISGFYEHYLRSILRMTHSSSDETKSVWLEHLLQYGEEYDKDQVSDNNGNGIDSLTGLVPNEIKEEFRHFLEVLLVENNRPIYQAVIDLDKNVKSNGEDADHMLIARNMLSEYHMRNANKFLSMQCNHNAIENQLIVLRDFYKELNNEEETGIDRYLILGEKIQCIVNLMAKGPGTVILFGDNVKEQSPVMRYLKMPDYFALYPAQIEDEMERETSNEKRLFEESWNQIKCNDTLYKSLNENGFYLMNSESKCDEYDIFIKLDNNYEALKKYDHDIRQDGVHQKIEPIYIYISCNIRRNHALNLTRMILMFRQKLIEWLEKDFNNEAIAVLSQQKHLARLLSTDKMGDHAENDFVQCQQRLLMTATLKDYKEEFEKSNWRYAISEMGKVEERFIVLQSDENNDFLEYLDDLHEWFFVRSYVNSRISRLFRTMVRTGNELSNDKIIDENAFYLCREQSLSMRPARNLQTIFFAPLKPGYYRRYYLREIMKTMTFSVENIPDYRENEDADIDERMENISQLFKEFEFIFFELEDGKKQYFYLSEYLVIILLDCFVSGLKAGEIWNRSEWGGTAFVELCKKKASEKCHMAIYREPGLTKDSAKYEYLVIKNKIFRPLRTEKKGPGMSQAAKIWYIEGLWRIRLNEGCEDYPKVQIEESETEYIIKLPILKPKEE